MNHINFSNFEEVKKAFPVDSTIKICGRTILITGYYYDTYNWWPINVVEGFNEKIKKDLLKNNWFDKPLPIQNGDCGFSTKEAAEQYLKSTKILDIFLKENLEGTPAPPLF